MMTDKKPKPVWCARDMASKKWISWDWCKRYSGTHGYHINKNNPKCPPIQYYKKEGAGARTAEIEEALGCKVEWVPIVFDSGNPPEGYTGVWTTPFSKLTKNELAQVAAFDLKGRPATIKETIAYWRGFGHTIVDIAHARAEWNEQNFYFNCIELMTEFDKKHEGKRQEINLVADVVRTAVSKWWDVVKHNKVNPDKVNPDKVNPDKFLFVLV